MGLVKTLGDTAGRVLLTPATVGAVAPYEGFRAFELVGDRLVGTTFVPGDKLRIHVGGLGLRTYTPIAWDGEHGSTLYRTTSYFLERLGLRGVEELPDLAPMLPELEALDDVDHLDSVSPGARRGDPS